VHRVARWLAVLSLLAVIALPSAARVRHNDAWARQQFSKAERMREALNGRPARERTSLQYQRVIDAYRRVYFGSPASSKADPSVVATAELMVEMGRRFDNNKILRGAVEQYRFLRKEYPGSKYRFDALFTIGEIYKDDLNDPEEARTTFEDFVRRYPRNRLAEDARAAVKEIDDAADKMELAERKGKRSGAKEVAGTVGRSELPRVTGVRHWSTPDYTRVAIDVEREVKFNSSRIANPDRIFFDLRDTKVASTLVGKTFDVDDGFLKKIRLAEFQPGRTRVVLEVDELSSYDAFLLPDPYRLIIDIHGKQSRAAMLAKAHRDDEGAAASSKDVASGDEEDAASDGAMEGNGDQRKSEKEHAIVVKAGKSGADTEEEEEDESAESKPEAAAKAGEGAKPVEKQSNGSSGVVRTTVAVKGSNVRIPKTIVSADDAAPPRVAKSAGGKKRKSGSSVHATNETSGETAPPDAGVEEAAVSSPEAVLATGARADASGKSSAAKSLRSKNSRTSAADNAADLETREARPTAAGDRSLTRALGLKIGKIVIDAGHGGHDTGTIGPHGLLEKDLVLDVAKRLGKALQARLGAEVVYTRRDDTFIPLETRTAIANRERADLFISIHANSSRDSDARGVETYYLNFTSSPEALEVAARENAVSEKSVHELQDLVKKIALKEKIDESREFAGDVQQSLYGGLALSNAGIRNRGIKKAPFIVLIGANMPSILAEISFVSNPTDERKLETSEQRQRIADSLYRGVARYAGGLSGVKVASRSVKNEGQ
jgi:N-acetylmuramoyl-L-alanine amidase